MTTELDYPDEFCCECDRPWPLDRNGDPVQRDVSDAHRAGTCILCGRPFLAVVLGDEPEHEHELPGDEP